MKKLIPFVAALIVAWGCATPGPKYIDLAYIGGPPVANDSGRMGLVRFVDKRVNTPRGQVGYRILGEKAKETFVVSEMDLSAALTRVTRSYLERKGFLVTRQPGWPRTAKGVAGVSRDFTHVLAADINQFECRARKKGAVTDMTLSIDLTLYLGTPGTRQLKTIPIALNMDRTELTFSTAKVALFVNQALEEILAKALPFPLGTP